MIFCPNIEFDELNNIYISNNSLAKNTTMHHKKHIIKNNTKDFTINESIDYIPIEQNNKQFWLIKDEKSINISGGPFLSGQWYVRKLNKLSYDSGENVILSDDKIIFKLGTYKIKALAVGYNVGIHQIRIFDITNKTVLSYGMSSYSNSNIASVSVLDTIIKIDSEIICQLEHRCQNNNKINGMGIASGWGDECYATMIIEKIT